MEEDKVIKSLLKLFYVLSACLHVCMYVCHMCAWCQGGQKEAGTLELEYRWL